MDTNVMRKLAVFEVDQDTLRKVSQFTQIILQSSGVGAGFDVSFWVYRVTNEV